MQTDRRLQSQRDLNMFVGGGVGGSARAWAQIKLQERLPTFFYCRFQSFDPKEVVPW